MTDTKRRLISVCVAMQVLTSCVALGQIRPNKETANYQTPQRQYVSKEYRGRVYKIEQSLVQTSPKIAEQAVVRLHRNIEVVLKKFPSHATADLKTVRFFIMHGPDAVGGGRPSGLAFIRNKQPERKKHLDLDWSNSIVIWCGKNYASITDLWAEKSVAHEFAHAYQLHRWPEKQPDILAAYNAAMERKLYHNVPNDKGGVTAKAYATVNQLEYFAELSAMYFVGCNYEPTNRRKLRDYDKPGYEMIEKMWAVRKGSVPPKGLLSE